MWPSVAFSEKLNFIEITFNFSLTENQTVKLCDSALSRDLFPSDYHCLGDNNNRPIKWMPLESINQNRFSRASDVVSINFLGSFWTPLPTLQSDVINGRSLAQVGETALFTRQNLELRHLVTSEEINRVAEF